jgi:hypothetical protein
VAVPAGVPLAAVAREAERLGARCVAGVMLDLYPASLDALERGGAFDPHAEWYFDGERHLMLRPDKPPRVLYPGARARLMSELGLLRPSMRDRMNRLIGKRRFPRYNSLQKLILRKWERGDWLLDAHSATVHPTTELLLPILHFKFNADVYRRIADALAQGQYVEGSKEYAALDRVLVEMRARRHPFLYRRSRPAGVFEEFERSGNARLGRALAQSSAPGTL